MEHHHHLEAPGDTAELTAHLLKGALVVEQPLKN
jgi:hypothetical protein